MAMLAEKEKSKREPGTFVWTINKMIHNSVFSLTKLDAKAGDLVRTPLPCTSVSNISTASSNEDVDRVPAFKSVDAERKWTANRERMRLGVNKWSTCSTLQHASHLPCLWQDTSLHVDGKESTWEREKQGENIWELPNEKTGLEIWQYYSFISWFWANSEPHLPFWEWVITGLFRRWLWELYYPEGKMPC